ncbi:MAG: hypothetical protein OH354_01820 [Candidatus Parvarchaeota archaeon]|nr:hypothetical protein [Candidatus Jingweiarchaeum tengchongense]
MHCLRCGKCCMFGIKVSEEDIKRVKEFYERFSPFLNELKRIRDNGIKKREDIMTNLFSIPTELWMNILILDRWNNIDEVINALEILKLRKFEDQIVFHPFFDSFVLRKIDGSTCGNFCIYYQIKNGVPTCGINVVKPTSCIKYFCERAKLSGEQG